MLLLRNPIHSSFVNIKVSITLLFSSALGSIVCCVPQTCYMICLKEYKDQRRWNEENQDTNLKQLEKRKRMGLYGTAEQHTNTLTVLSNYINFSCFNILCIFKSLL